MGSESCIRDRRNTDAVKELSSIKADKKGLDKNYVRELIGKLRKAVVDDYVPKSKRLLEKKSREIKFSTNLQNFVNFHIRIQEIEMINGNVDVAIKIYGLISKKFLIWDTVLSGICEDLFLKMYGHNADCVICGEFIQENDLSAIGQCHHVFHSNVSLK